MRFCIAGLEVLLRSQRAGGLGPLLGSYRHYPSSGREPGLIVEIERIPGFADGREPGAEYPAFRRRRVTDHRIDLWRHDAEGEIFLPEADGPVRGRFRVGESGNTLEAAVRVGASIALPRLGGLILHASAVEWRGEVLVFAGVSGAGKSTIAALLAGSFDAVRRISDELLIVMPDAPTGGRWSAYVTPFLGSEGLPHGASLPLGGIHFLAQTPHHARTPVPHREAVRELLRHVLVYVAEADTAARVLDAASRMIADVPAYRLEFARDPGVGEVLGIT